MPDVYRGLMQDALDRQEMKREAMWTDSLAVGGREFVERVGKRIKNRMKVSIEAGEQSSGLWMVRERNAVYG